MQTRGASWQSGAVVPLARPLAEHMAEKPLEVKTDLTEARSVRGAQKRSHQLDTSGQNAPISAEIEKSCSASTECDQTGEFANLGLRRRAAWSPSLLVRVQRGELSCRWLRAALDCEF